MLYITKNNLDLARTTKHSPTRWQQLIQKKLLTKMKTKFILIVVFQIVFSVLAFPAAFIIMLVFGIESHSKFISAADGSTGPAFYAFLKI